MQVNKGVKRKKQRLNLPENIRIYLAKRNISFGDMCEENSILRQSAEKAFKGKLNGEKGKEYIKTLNDAANENRFLTEQSSSQAE